MTAVMEDSGGFRCVWDQRVVLLLKLLYTFLKEFVLFSQMGTQRNGFKRGGFFFFSLGITPDVFSPRSHLGTSCACCGTDEDTNLTSIISLFKAMCNDFITTGMGHEMGCFYNTV